MKGEGLRKQPSWGDPGYLPYCACPGFHRAVRGKDGFDCRFGRCFTGVRTVNGIDMFAETAPDEPGYDWKAHAARQATQGEQP